MNTFEGAIITHDSVTGVTLIDLRPLFTEAEKSLLPIKKTVGKITRQPKQTKRRRTETEMLTGMYACWKK